MLNWWVLLHAGRLPPGLPASIRALLEQVFKGDFDEDGWANTLGGAHALTFEGADLVGHAALVQRRLLRGGRMLNTGYVEGVTVPPAHRRRGIAGALMASPEGLLRGYDVGALSASDEGTPCTPAEGLAAVAWADLRVDAFGGPRTRTAGSTCPPAVPNWTSTES